MNIEQMIWVLCSALLLQGCVMMPKHNALSKLPPYPTLETIDVEGYTIYYRDLSDPCDPGSTAWNYLRTKKRTEQVDGQCSEPVVTEPTFVPAVNIPETDFVLLFTMRSKTLRTDENDETLAELATMRDWPIRYHVYGAAGGVGPALEKLGMKRANVVKQGLVDAGIAESKIDVMPYDPTIPGLRAVVKLTGEGV